MMTGFGGLGGLGSMFGLGGILMLGMGLIPILLVGLVVWAVIEASRRRDDRTTVSAPAQWTVPSTAGAPAGLVAGQPTVSAALTILEERYARGEIDRDDYLARRQDLRQ